MALADVSLRVADAEVVSLTGVDGVRVLERDLAEGETAWVLAGVYHDEARAPVLLAFLVDMAAGHRPLLPSASTRFCTWAGRCWAAVCW
jgi:hypothetical protein